MGERKGGKKSKLFSTLQNKNASEKKRFLVRFLFSHTASLLCMFSVRIHSIWTQMWRGVWCHQRPCRPTDTRPGGDITSGRASVYLYFLLYSHFVYRKIACCRVVRGRSGRGYETFHRKRTLKSANVCVYLFVNTYTQNTPVQNALWYTIFGKKQKNGQKKKKNLNFFH